MNTARRSLKRWLVYFALAAAVASNVFLFDDEVRAFVYDYDGVGFYARQPHLIVVCLVVAIAAGLLIERLARRNRRP
ncbi:MAG: hypothetical protein ABR915_08880 [Thermoguttaceae bacterium]|jgi:hypothetical protein